MASVHRSRVLKIENLNDSFWCGLNDFWSQWVDPILLVHLVLHKTKLFQTFMTLYFTSETTPLDVGWKRNHGTSALGKGELFHYPDCVCPDSINPANGFSEPFLPAIDLMHLLRWKGIVDESVWYHWNYETLLPILAVHCNTAPGNITFTLYGVVFTINNFLISITCHTVCNSVVIISIITTCTIYNK